jgi:hypothetical protein
MARCKGLLILALCAAPIVVDSQPLRVYRVGVLVMGGLFISASQGFSGKCSQVRADEVIQWYRS